MTLYADFEDISNVSSFSASNLGVSFYACTSEDLRSHWKLIQPELEKTIEHSPEQGICSGDVFLSLVEGKSFLYILETKNGKYLGFIVVQVYTEYNDRKCHVWLMGLNQTGYFSEAVKVIVNIARHYKCNKITCSSTRKGMGTAIARFGFVSKFVSYEMEI